MSATLTTAAAIVTGGVRATSMPLVGDTYGPGETIAIWVTFDNAVTVGTSGGTPRIQFRLDGAVNRWAEYSSSFSSTDLVFTYVVQSGDMDADGIWLPANFLQLQGGTISAAADTTVAATLTYAQPGRQSEHKVDGGPTLSTDATLSALALSGVTLAPTFASATQDYTATVVNAVMQTTVTATPTHSGATVAFKDGADNALTNPVTLAVGANVIKAVVTAEDTTTMKPYMVTVTREDTTVVNNPPMIFFEETGLVEENAPPGVDVGHRVTATDADNDPLIFTLEGTDAASFNLVTLPDSARLRTKTGVTYDYETKSSYSVIVKVDDGHGGTATASMTINVTDVNEPPARPAAPSVSSVADSTTRLSVSWSAPSNTGRPAIVNYDLQYRQGTTGNWTDGPQNVRGTSATIAGLTAAPTAYQVQVRATNRDGDGPWSPPGRIRTTPPPPPDPEPVPTPALPLLGQLLLALGLTGAGARLLSRRPGVPPAA